MKNSGRNISLSSYDDIFKTEETREAHVEQQPAPMPVLEKPQEAPGHEKVQMLPLNELHPFHNHPFKVKDDEQMAETVESVKQYGVLVPAIARPLDGGGYELVAGHRRHHASELAGLTEMPVIVRNLDDDAATLLMVDSNLQRETLLPSERAFAYRMKLEAIKHQGLRSDLTSTQVAQKLSVEKVGGDAGVSKDQVRRFIRLTALTPELLDMVDTKKIAFNPAVELSYLKQAEQHQLLDAMDSEQSTPSLSQAQRLKKFSQEEKLTPDMMVAIMSEEKKPEQEKLTFTGDKLRKFFPKSYTPQQMEQTIFKLLEQWQKKRQQELER
ncbi:MAG: ParB/RepB/Spo0J family partition protein [Clostridia bacterium]